MKKRTLKSGIYLPQGRNYIVADFVSGVFIGQICAVGHKADALLRAILLQFRPCKAYKRSDYIFSLFGNSAKSRKTGTPCGVENKSFGTVRKTVRGSYFCVFTEFFGAVLKKIIANLPSGFFCAQAVLGGIFRNRCRKNPARHAEIFAHFEHKAFVPVAFFSP